MEDIRRTLLNKNLDDPKTQILLSQYEHRIIKNDDANFIVTHDYHPTRLNLSIRNNVIEEITFG